VNDSFGHAAGNRLLRAVVTAVRRNLRECGTVARYGGGEFVLLLPETDAAAAQAALLKVQEVLRETARVEGREVSCSIGAVTYGDGQVSPGQAIHHADALMYTAKQAGKGRCRHATAEEPEDRSGPQSG
jgi:diguanylate cyclase (GGDEF)-like protein